MDAKTDTRRALRLEAQQVRADLDAIATEVARAVEWRGVSPRVVARLRQAIRFYDEADAGETWSKGRDHDGQDG
jgi:hypothetical protein